MLIGMAVANIWFYIRKLEFENEMLVKAFETKLMLQFKDKIKEEPDDSN
jgi:hypothetical protein